MTAPRFPERDPRTLAEGQYRTEANLRARAVLHERFGTGAPWHDWLFGWLPEATPLRVLEIGCGGGRFWQDNAGRVPDGWQLTLTDLSPGMLEAARTGLGARGLTARFERLDATALETDDRFDDGAFDLVLANHMLYHVPDIDAALQGVRRVLAPGGRLLAATNGAGHMQELWDLARAHLPRERWLERGRLAFDLENGLDWLKPHFDTVELHRRDDAPLEITEVGAVVDYVASLVGVAGAPAEELDPETAELLAAVRARVASTLGEHRAFHVRRVTGVFEAS